MHNSIAVAMAVAVVVAEAGAMIAMVVVATVVVIVMSAKVITTPSMRPANCSNEFPSDKPSFRRSSYPVDRKMSSR